MSALNYTITKFDDQLKLVDVVFEDGSWAQVRLAKPLPKDTDELESIIKQFAAPIEAIEAQNNPDVDLSYINGLVGTPRTCERFSLSNIPAPGTNITPQEPAQLDPEVQQKLMEQEKAEFQARVAEALANLGVTTQ